MLVLSRKVGEKIVIDGGITITITKVSGNRVAIGVSAPEDVRVVRGELKELPSGEVDRAAPLKVRREKAAFQGSELVNAT